MCSSVNYLSLYFLHTQADSDDDFDVAEEPALLTPGSQRQQFAERFDRWLQNLRQQQLRLFSSCTSRVGNVESDKDADPGPETQSMPPAELEHDSGSGSELETKPDPDPETENEAEAGTGTDMANNGMGTL
ncbi:uncharacterized protein Dsimw501_GD27023 [Drosophila simulans]|nr:uncharacterized protein Dsimw501_GD27023 [Drosophila simulans]